MTYPLRRRFVGYWTYPVGRPTSNVQPKWKQCCNFVFKTKMRIDAFQQKVCENGWLLEITSQEDAITRCFVPTTIVSSSALLNKHLMSHIPGAISRIKSEDFLDFVAHDNPRAIGYCVSQVGKFVHNDEAFWVFSNGVLDNEGMCVDDANLVLSTEYIRNNFVVPRALPRIEIASHEKVRSHLKCLMRCIRRVYPETFMHVLHILTSALKAIHFDTILEKGYSKTRQFYQNMIV